MQKLADGGVSKAGEDVAAAKGIETSVSAEVVRRAGILSIIKGALNNIGTRDSSKMIMAQIS
jgi:hypothetical protein